MLSICFKYLENLKPYQIIFFSKYNYILHPGTGVEAALRCCSDSAKILQMRLRTLRILHRDKIFLIQVLLLNELMILIPDTSILTFINYYSVKKMYFVLV
jgi:hypothetical protein